MGWLGDPNANDQCDTSAGFMVYHVGGDKEDVDEVWTGLCCCRCPCCASVIDLTSQEFDTLYLDVVGGTDIATNGCANWNGDCYQLTRDGILNPSGSETGGGPCRWNVGMDEAIRPHMLGMLYTGAPSGTDPCGSVASPATLGLQAVRFECKRGAVWEEEHPCPEYESLPPIGGGRFTLTYLLDDNGCYDTPGEGVLQSTSVSCDPFRVAFSLSQIGGLSLSQCCDPECEISQTELVIWGPDCDDDC